MIRKLPEKVITTFDKELLQRDLDKLSNFAHDWQMKFNVEKSRVMHIGINNDNVEYLMNGVELSVTNTEKDLGVMISADNIYKLLKPLNPRASYFEKRSKFLGRGSHFFSIFFGK